MPAYSFKERFVPLILNGSKRQTIRKKRRGQAKPGSTLYLYFGMRTKWCKKLMEVKCREVKEITITPTEVFIDGCKVRSVIKLNELAESDGFENWHSMLKWWRQTHELPFIGDIIYW